MPETLNARRIKFSFIIMSLIFFLILCGFSLAWVANSHRIDDIQTNRVESCKETYDAFPKVFKPFFPPVKQRTEKQKNDLKKLINTVNDLKSGCDKQVNADEGE